MDASRGGPRRPTFLVIGAQKAATTTLYHWLRSHPEVFLPELKETNFLLDVGAWDRGVSWYESLYAEGARHRHRGDVSPAYAVFPLARHAPERAAHLLPDARLVYIIRDPVERMVSAWAQLVGAGFEHRELVAALRHEAHYTWASMYALQASQWLRFYDRQALLVLRMEDLAAAPGAVLDQLLTHLGLAAGWRPPDLSRTWNRSDQKQTVPRSLRLTARALRAAGQPRVARGLGPDGRIGQRLARPLPAAHLDPGLRHDLAEIFRSDLACLRAIVGDDMDLWGLA